jgi:[ribosomal protein S18]-alanine N-acetyltransferase
MPSRVLVRAAKSGDMEEILDVERASFGEDAYDRKLFAELTRKCGELFLVASKGDKVLGYAVTCICAGGSELVSIAVHPDHRGGGAASALLNSTLRRLRRRGVARLSLTVKVTNLRALAFYGKFGFRKTRRVPRYYEDGADGYRFVRVL